MTEEKLTLDAHGKDFLLRQTDRSGTVSEIILTPQSLLTLARSSKRLEGQILAEQNTAEVATDVHMPVAQISLNVDLHLSNILLGMIDPNGAVERFCVPLEVAKPFAEKLPARVAEIEEAIPTQTKQ